MNRYGQAIIWGSVGAPHPFSGICTSFDYRDAYQSYLDEDENGDPRALLQHGHKGELNFEAKITSDSTNWLDLGAAGAALTIPGINSAISGSILQVAPALTGEVLCSRAVESWRLNQPKKASIQASHYMDMATSGSTAATANISAVTPTQTLSALLNPAAALTWSTAGITHAAGIVHSLTLTQELTITEDEEDPSGKILGATAHGYLRRIEMELLAKSAQAIPAAGATTTFSAGGPTNAADYQIENSEQVFANSRGVLYRVAMLWIGPFTS